MYRKLCFRMLAVRSWNQNQVFRSIGSTVYAPPPPDQLIESMIPFRSGSAEEGFCWKSSYGEIGLQNMTVDEYVWKNLPKWQNKIAIVCGITGRKYSYGKLRDHCGALAYRLRTDFNMKPGDVVAISMPNVPEYAIVVLAAMEAGLTITTVNPTYSAADQAKQFAMTDTKIIFSLVDNAEDMLEACSLNKVNCPIVAVRVDQRQWFPDGVIDLGCLTTPADYIKNSSNRRSPSDICVLPFSSGTSGLPKGVMLTHSNIASNMESINVPNPKHTLTMPTTFDFQEVLPCVLPFFHIYGFTFLLLSKLSLGCKLVTLPRFDPETFISTLLVHKATFLALVPPILLSLINDDRCTPHHLSHVRSALSGAAPLGGETIERFRNAKGRNVEILQAYGMTETSPVTFMCHRKYINYASIGYPSASTEAKIVKVDDPFNRGLDANESGELMVRGPNVMLGYLNNPTETAKVLGADGWLHTGDIGYYDTNGDFYVTDRCKELIKVQANQVAPAELEEILLSHPNILDAAVIGVKHDKYGEVPKAFIVRKDEKLTSAEVQEYIVQRCVKYKWLIGGVQFIDIVPKSNTGKILRRKLKEINE